MRFNQTQQDEPTDSTPSPPCGQPSRASPASRSPQPELPPAYAAVRTVHPFAPLASWPFRHTHRSLGVADIAVGGAAARMDFPELQDEEPPFPLAVVLDDRVEVWEPAAQPCILQVRPGRRQGGEPVAGCNRLPCCITILGLARAELHGRCNAAQRSR